MTLSRLSGKSLNGLSAINRVPMHELMPMFYSFTMWLLHLMQPAVLLGLMGFHSHVRMDAYSCTCLLPTHVCISKAISGILHVQHIAIAIAI